MTSRPKRWRHMAIILQFSYFNFEVITRVLILLFSIRVNCDGELELGFVSGTAKEGELAVWNSSEN